MEKQENEGMGSMKRHDSFLHFQIWANIQFQMPLIQEVARFPG